MSLKLLVIGIDGAAFPIVSRLVADGRMPALAKLIESGTWGALEATFPPHTAPGWASLFTGVQPGEHGIYQFWETQSADYSPRIRTMHDFGWEPLWQTLSRHGLRVGMVNVPMSHPPTSLPGGYMISWPLSPTIHYSEPPSLIRELAKAGLHYHSDLVTMYNGDREYAERAEQFIIQRTRTLNYLMENRPVDALIAVYTEVDRVSHYYWGERSEPGAEVVKIYETMDRAVGDLIQHASEDTLVVIASDHGFGVCHRNLNVHHLLEQAGIMKVDLIPADHGKAFNSDELIGSDGSPNWFRSSSRYVRAIDWSNTLAYMPTPGCYGLNLNRRGREKHGIVDVGAEATVVQHLTEAFAALRDEDGAPYFEVVPSHTVYRGHRVADAPDLLLLPKRWDIMPHPTLEPQLWSPPSQVAIHRMEGILCLRGRGVSRQLTANATIEDVTPTILAYLGMPIPAELDGRSLFPGMGTGAQEGPLRVCKASAPTLSTEEVAQLEARLHALGYM